MGRIEDRKSRSSNTRKLLSEVQEQEHHISKIITGIHVSQYQYQLRDSYRKLNSTENDHEIQSRTYLRPTEGRIREGAREVP
jgi:hypothetical protein